MTNKNVVQYLEQAPDADRGALVLVSLLDHYTINHHVMQVLDVALGLEYLHIQAVVHGDLKGVHCSPFLRSRITADFVCYPG
jgi:hypothetical protein